MLVDKRNLGFGQRSWRYSMLVDDGVVKKMFVEPEVEGDPFDVSDADTMLKYLDPNAKAPSDVLMIGRPGCSHCARAKELLDEDGLRLDEVLATPRNLRAVSGQVDDAADLHRRQVHRRCRRAREVPRRTPQRSAAR